jgi:intracellular sulfur oxidation DsrE/DsrF family protein
MTLEQKKALQGLLLDEVTQRLKDHPTMLIDILLNGQGVAFLHGLLAQRRQVAAQSAELFDALLAGLGLGQQQSIDPEDEAAA